MSYLDYGARMYDSRIGRWFNVDPASERYYSYSPFHFSGNNPIKFVDSNGAWYDGYLVDGWGFFSWVNYVGEDEYDVIYSWDGFAEAVINWFKGEGFVTDLCITISPQFMESHERKKRGKYGDSDLFGISDYYYLTDEKEAKNIFEFLADNTMVEWSHNLFADKYGNTMNGIMTSHLKDDVFDWGYMYIIASAKGYDHIIWDDHNHPTGGGAPSDADIKHATRLQGPSYNSPDVKFHIYFNGKYYEYDKNSKQKKGKR